MPALAFFLVVALALHPAGTFGEPTEASRSLALGAEDLRIEQLRDGGYHLYVRAKEGLGSILLTESTKDPAKKTDSFALRALEKNAINGDEARILDGKNLPASSELHFLVDSSPEPDAGLGRAFHIFIPWVVAWGYPWSRSGKAFIHDGTFINIRAFAKPYADYSGPFADNPYLVRVSQAAATSAPAAAPTSFKASLYFPETVASFGAIAKARGGELRFATSDEDIVAEVDALLAMEKGKSLDLVFCIDTTDTMINGLAALKARLPALLSKRLADFPAFRLGIVAFKDYFEEYLYKRMDFVRDLGTFSSELGSLEGGGGRDIPEAVYEALYAASSEFPWAAQARLVILVGDAPPHPLPRGSVDWPAVEEAAASAGVKIDTVAAPK